MGISREQIFSEIDMFKRGVRPLELEKPATINDGIVRLTEKKCQDLIKTFSEAPRSKKIIKFVPASGAASRMFNVLYDFFLHSKEISEPEIIKKAESGDINSKFLCRFINGIKKHRFAFFNELKGVMERDGIKIGDLISQGTYGQIAEYLLTPKGMNYLNLPKDVLVDLEKLLIDRKAIEYTPKGRSLLVKGLGVLEKYDRA